MNEYTTQGQAHTFKKQPVIPESGAAVLIFSALMVFAGVRLFNFFKNKR